MTSRSNHTTQRDQIFNMINYMATPSFFFTYILAFVYHPLIDVLIGQDINLDVFHDNNMLNKNEICKQATVNLKV
jgi:hypothetical protein